MSDERNRVNGKITDTPLPCPFCGVVPVIVNHDGTWESWLHPEDQDCILGNTIVTGVADWNMRTPA